MPLRPSPTARTREMLLLYGKYGSGKSFSWATMRKWWELTSTPGHFHIISTEPESNDEHLIAADRDV